jgi:transposase InsO family protein
MIIALIDDAVRNGARRQGACAMVGLSARTLERWRGRHPTDARHGPLHAPANKLSATERDTIFATVNRAEYRDLSPHQIVPRLADDGCYLASESTLYRVLRDAQQDAHRGRTKASVRRTKPVHMATGPNQVWSWDITYLRTPVRGVFVFLYLIMDIWSRRIVGWAIHREQRDDPAATLFEATCARRPLDPQGLVLHADNGGPMKGATMVSTLERLGVVPSFNRPGVSNDNPFSEALFRTLKYCPVYPTHPFADATAARQWVTTFVHWYNHVHHHSAIRFVTPDARHAGRDIALLACRDALYACARARHPARWSGHTRNWAPIRTVRLNPEQEVPPSDSSTIS